MGIRGAKPSIEKARSDPQTYVPAGLVDGIARPDDLTEAASGVWDVLLADLIASGVFRPADAIILTEVCEMIVESKKLRYRMQNPPEKWYRFEPDLTKDEKDEFDLQADHMQDQLDELWMLSTTYKRLRVSYLQTMRTLKSYIDEFGVTPVARLRLGLLQLQGAGLMDAFMADDDSDVVDAPRSITAEFTVVDEE